MTREERELMVVQTETKKFELAISTRDQKNSIHALINKTNAEIRLTEIHEKKYDFQRDWDKSAAEVVRRNTLMKMCRQLQVIYNSFYY